MLQVDIRYAAVELSVIATVVACPAATVTAPLPVRSDGTSAPVRTVDVALGEEVAVAEGDGVAVAEGDRVAVADDEGVAVALGIAVGVAPVPVSVIAGRPKHPGHDAARAAPTVVWNDVGDPGPATTVSASDPASEYPKTSVPSAERAPDRLTW